MGGLILKKILIKAKEKKIIHNVKGVLFFSTPHYGSTVIKTILQSGIKKYSKFFRIIETTSSEYGLQDEDILQRLTALEFTNATDGICFTPKEEFEKEHEEFKNLGIDYICINESDKTYIYQIGQHVHIVHPESSYLPETENLIVDNKVHSNVQKFNPENMNEEGYQRMIKFIRKSILI
jgi:hypothetical protein